MIEPLFEQIEHFGSGKLSTKDKVEIVTDVKGVLCDLGLDASLATDITTNTIPLQPLLGLTYRRRIATEDNIKLEGRGVYHDNIPVAGRKSIVYVKGVGNDQMLNCEIKPDSFSAFPNSTDRIMFDHMLTMSHHPRIIGTETLSWGFLEFIDASVVFAELAKKYGWKKIEDALEAGVTIPIGMLHFKELSSRMQDLLKQRIAETPHDYEKDFLNWKGNFVGLGSVGHIVPSDERFARIPNEEYIRTPIDRENAEKDYLRLKESSRWEVAGQTLRHLLDMGIVYSEESSHGQNLYTKGLMATGDNSDFVFLGDYKDGEITYMFFPKDFFNRTEQRVSLIYEQLRRYSGLTPLAYPVPDYSVSKDEVEMCQLKFWSEFLRGVAHPEAIKKIPQLMPALRDHINWAAAMLSVEQLESSQWDETARLRQNVFKKYDRFDAGLELEKKIAGNFPYNTIVDLYRYIASANDPLGVKSILKFLKTGDISLLKQDHKITPYLELIDSIGKISDSLAKDKLLYQLGELQRARNYEWLANPESNQMDLIDWFNNEHLELIENLIIGGRYEEAGMVMETLVIADSWRLAVDHPKPPFEPASLSYAMDLLDRFKDIKEIYSQVRYLQTLHRFGCYTSRGLIASVLLSKTKLDIVDYAYNANVSNPDWILHGILGKFIDDPKIRPILIKYIQDYENDFLRLLGTDDQSEASQIVANLEKMAESMQDFPELGFAHNAIMVNYYMERDQAKAEKYYAKALNYYETHYEKRKKEMGVQHDIWRTNLELARQKRRVAHALVIEECQSRGFEKIVKHYS